MRPQLLNLAEQESRKLPNFLDAWNLYVEGLPSCILFLVWAGIFCVSAALGRRVWTQGDPSMPRLFPNLYAMAVGTPGIGKDIAINTASALLAAANEHVEKGYEIHLAGESLSAKGVIDKLNCDQARKIFRYIDLDGKEHTEECRSLIACVPELGTLLPEYDTRLISNLNELYNCKPSFQETIRGGAGHVQILNPHIAMLMGSQPDTLYDIMPEKSFRMGFTARIIFIHGSSVTKRPIINTGTSHKKILFHDLAKELAAIAQLSGEFQFAPEVVDLINQFHLYDSDSTAVPGKRFEHYNVRRSLHAQKLAIIFSAAESSRRIIEVKHWHSAIDLLFRTEKEMPKIFETIIGSRGFSDKLDDLVSLAKGGIVLHSEAVRLLSRRCPAHEINYILSMAIAGGVLTELPGSPRKYKVGFHV